MTTRPSKLNVLHVVDSLEFGGLERVVTDLAIEQQARNHAVAVFSINETTGFSEELRAAGIDVIVGHKKKPFDLQVLKILRREAKQRGVQIVHAHNFTPNYYSATALLGAWNMPALVGTCHDMGARLANRKLRIMYRWSVTRTQGLAMVGQQVHDRYVESGMVPARKVTTVLNGIPVERFTSTPQRQAQARAKLGLNPDDLVIGCVGRLVDLKNHALLLQVMPALVQRHPRLKLVIVGYGELEEALHAQTKALGIAQQVTITGKRSDVADLLPAFDVFALPSKTEGLSIALLEACATGLAVVASAVGGNPEIIHDGQTGLLVPSQDAPALQHALDRLLGDAPLRASLSAQARDWVRQNASVAALADAYDHFYQQALQRR